MQPPTGNDADYPHGWPPLKGLGSECKNLNGAYGNEGVLVDAHGISTTIRLTDLVDAGDAFKSYKVTFLVGTKRKDPNQDTIGSLHAISDAPSHEIERRFESFCIKGVLFFVASITGGSSTVPFPPSAISPMAWGTQQNVWFSHGADGSLIAKVGKYTAAAAGVLPLYTETIGWARFNRITN